MGFESFRVELRGTRAKHDEAHETVRKLPHVRLDSQSVGCKPVVAATSGVAASCQLAGFARRQARKLAACGYGPETPPRANTGMHPNPS